MARPRCSSTTRPRSARATQPSTVVASGRWSNVIIGDSASSGGRPVAASLTAMGQPSVGAGGGQAAASAGSASSPSSSLPSSGPGTTNSRPNAGSTKNASNPQAQEAPEPDKFTLWVKPDAIRGGTMVGETVQILDPASKQVIAEAEVDKDGNVLASVPENKPYDLNIVGDRDIIPGEGIENEDIASSTMHIALFDYAGQPVEEGLKVTVTGNATTYEFHTTADGSISPQLPDGVYDVEINGQKFSAHTLRWIDLAHEGGSPFEFQLAPDDSELDYNVIEQARQNRTRPSESDEE